MLTLLTKINIVKLHKTLNKILNSILYPGIPFLCCMTHHNSFGINVKDKFLKKITRLKLIDIKIINWTT